VTVFNVGDFPVALKDVFGTSPGLSRYFGTRSLARSTPLPSNSMFVTSGRTKLVVDPGDSARFESSWEGGAGGKHSPPLPLTEQLEAMGVDPGQITHVVVTHLHFDHFAGVTQMKGGLPVPTFPNARHIIPAKDWVMPDIADARKKNDKDVTDTLGVIDRAGIVELLDGRKSLGGGITIEPAPGESPGHQLLAVSSRGRKCYCVGDLYHVKEEVEHPELAGTWADVPVLLESRRKFAAKAAKDRALVLPAHMDPGVIRFSRGKFVWSVV